MKRILLCCIVLLAMFCFPAMAEDNGMVRVEGTDSSAFLYSAQEQTLLLGYVDYDTLMARHPDVQVTGIVICCDHMGHVENAKLLAAQLDAELIDKDSECSLIEWQNGAAVVGEYVFSAYGPVSGMKSYDCNGVPYAYLASTTQKAVNVRKEPSTKADRVMQLKLGTVVTVLEETQDAKGVVWYKVRLESGAEGYVRGDLLKAGAETTPAPEPTSKPASGKDNRYVGNKNSKVFHRPDCESLPKGKNAVYFSSRSYAIAKGYRPCEHCDP